MKYHRITRSLGDVVCILPDQFGLARNRGLRLEQPGANASVRARRL